MVFFDMLYFFHAFVCSFNKYIDFIVNFYFSSYSVWQKNYILFLVEF